MISESEIQDALSAVERNELPLFEFAEWLDAKSWGMHRDSEPEAIRLASSIERVLAEYDHHNDENVLRRELMAFVAPKRVVEFQVFFNAQGVSQLVAPVSASSSAVEKVPQKWVPELASSGYS